MHAAKILTPTKTKVLPFSLLARDRQSLFWPSPHFFMSNFQSQCSLTIIVITSNGQHILEHTVQENTAKAFKKITLNSC